MHSTDLNMHFLYLELYMGSKDKVKRKKKKKGKRARKNNGQMARPGQTLQKNKVKQHFFYS